MSSIQSIRRINLDEEHIEPGHTMTSTAAENGDDFIEEGDSRWKNRAPASPAIGFGGLRRTQSAFSMPLTGSLSLSSISGSSSGSLVTEIVPKVSSHRFALAMRDYIENGSVNFGAGTRKAMEPFLREARSLREMTRSRTEIKVDAAIAGSVGVPYICLRDERPFLFDENTYPLHDILAATLDVPELSLAHEVSKEELLRPLLCRENRQVFQYAYDNFVTSFCLPLLHSVAISKNLFSWASPSDSITYRYQAFPTIRIARPGCPAEPPRCGTTQGHSIGCLFFHIPLTPSSGDAAIFVESHPGREDWHPLQTKSVGLGYLYDGARCLQFSFENSSSRSRVSLDFCVLLYRDKGDAYSRTQLNDGWDLCTQVMRQDSFAAGGPGYYEEAIIDLRQGVDAVIRKSRKLVDPDSRFGHPF